jgi:hypothetical protein
MYSEITEGQRIINKPLCGVAEHEGMLHEIQDVSKKWDYGD